MRLQPIVGQPYHHSFFLFFNIVDKRISRSTTVAISFFLFKVRITRSCDRKVRRRHVIIPRWGWVVSPFVSRWRPRLPNYISHRICIQFGSRCLAEIAWLLFKRSHLNCTQVGARASRTLVLSIPWWEWVLYFRRIHCLPLEAWSRYWNRSTLEMLQSKHE